MTAEVRVDERGNAANCPFCHAPVVDLEPSWDCPACSTRHHRDCVVSNGARCTIMGCGGAYVAPKLQRPPRPPGRPLRWVAVAAVVAVLLGVGVATWLAGPVTTRPADASNASSEDERDSSDGRRAPGVEREPFDSMLRLTVSDPSGTLGVTPSEDGVPVPVDDGWWARPRSFTRDALDELAREVVREGIPGLDLSDSTLRDLELEWFVDASLLRLDVSETRITDRGAACLKELATLRWLSVRACPRITDASVARWETLARLEHLDLGETAVADASMPVLARLPLRELSLASTYVSDDGVFELARTRTLRSLSLARAKGITDEALEHLAGVATLRSLDLSYTRATDLGVMADLRRLADLEELDLTGCARVTDESVRALSSLTKLRSLKLPDGITEAGEEALQLALPACRVERAR